MNNKSIKPMYIHNQRRLKLRLRMIMDDQQNDMVKIARQRDDVSLYLRYTKM